jgi:hypothetical protein
MVRRISLFYLTTFKDSKTDVTFMIFHDNRALLSVIHITYIKYIMSCTKFSAVIQPLKWVDSALS